MEQVDKFDHPENAVDGAVWSDAELHLIREKIAAAVAEEREACAKLCDDMAALRDSWWEARAMPEDQGAAICAAELADAIRKRSN